MFKWLKFFSETPKEMKARHKLESACLAAYRHLLEQRIHKPLTLSYDEIMEQLQNAYNFNAEVSDGKIKRIKCLDLSSARGW